MVFTIKKNCRIGVFSFYDKNLIKKELSGIKGIGSFLSSIILKVLKIPNIAICDLTDVDLKKLEIMLKSEIIELPVGLPQWANNSINDKKTYCNTERILKTKEDINRLKKLKSYVGLRHTYGLKVHGQRTRSTGRKKKQIGGGKK